MHNTNLVTYLRDIPYSGELGGETSSVCSYWLEYEVRGNLLVGSLGVGWEYTEEAGLNRGSGC